MASAWYDPLNKETIFLAASLKSSTAPLCPIVDSTRYVASAPSLLATLNPIDLQGKYFLTVLQSAV